MARSPACRHASPCRLARGSPWHASLSTALLAFGLLSNAWAAPPQGFSAPELQRRSVERRAVEAVIWGMPAVNYERMLQAASRQRRGS